MSKELIYSLSKDDFIFQVFCAGGKGGQHQNKTSSGVRIIHKESGAVGESRSERSQHQNKKLAFTRLTKSAKFKLWHTKKCCEVLSGKTLDQKVNEMMQEKYLKVEMKDTNKWEQYTG